MLQQSTMVIAAGKEVFAGYFYRIGCLGYFTDRKQAFNENYLTGRKYGASLCCN
jgi:aspartate aminotransferase-like enzyme